MFIHSQTFITSPEVPVIIKLRSKTKLRRRSAGFEAIFVLKRYQNLEKFSVDRNVTDFKFTYGW